MAKALTSGKGQLGLDKRLLGLVIIVSMARVYPLTSLAGLSSAFKNNQ